MSGKELQWDCLVFMDICLVGNFLLEYINLLQLVSNWNSERLLDSIAV